MKSLEEACDEVLKNHLKEDFNDVIVFQHPYIKDLQKIPDLCLFIYYASNNICERELFDEKNLLDHIIYTLAMNFLSLGITIGIKMEKQEIE